MEPVVKLENIRKDFKKIEALKGLSMSFPAGRISGVIGPNGSGKTTLMRILAGISRPTSGAAHVLGRLMPDRSVRARIGYMTQAEALYQDLTVRENLQFFGGLYGLGSNDLAHKADRLMDLVELAARRDSRAEELSGGLRRRLSLACALIHEPRLLLLDEPTVGVDPELRVQFWDHFRRLVDGGASILVSTHYLDEARRCDWLCLMRDGELLKEGAPQALMAEAATDSLEDAFLFFARGKK